MLVDESPHGAGAGRGNGGFMYSTFSSAPLRASTLQLLWVWFHRGVAVLGLVSGLFYWTRLIGINDGAEWRFDLMSVHWQVVSVTLAVLFPFAARSTESRYTPGIAGISSRRF